MQTMRKVISGKSKSFKHHICRGNGLLVPCASLEWGSKCCGWEKPKVTS